jgi:hypothetical protein
MDLKSTFHEYGEMADNIVKSIGLIEDNAKEAEWRIVVGKQRKEKVAAIARLVDHSKWPLYLARMTPFKEERFDIPTVEELTLIKHYVSNLLDLEVLTRI